MPRVHFVKAARKDNPVAKVGEPYYWWKFRYGGKRYSLTRPKPSQLTQSEYFSRLRALVEELEAQPLSAPDELESMRDSAVQELEELRDEQEEKRSNMPEGLQDAPTGELLQERYDALDNAISTLEDFDPDEWENENGEEPETDREARLNDAHDYETVADWFEAREQWMEDKRSEMIDAIGEAEV